jgi:hypothetical protein
MSYDFAGLVDTGGDEPYYIEPYFSDTHPAFDTDGMAGTAIMGGGRCGNYTSNVSPMWTRCLTAALGSVEPVSLGGLAGQRCGDIAPLLRLAVEWGVEHIAELREINPDNGWGNAEGAVTYLWDIQRFCEAHPKCDLYISR